MSEAFEQSPPLAEAALDENETVLLRLATQRKLLEQSRQDGDDAVSERSCRGERWGGEGGVHGWHMCAKSAAVELRAWGVGDSQVEGLMAAQFACV